MSNLIVTDLGKQWIAKIAMTGGHPHLDGNVNMHLYTNVRTPTESDIVSDYTEASYPGYAPVLLSGATDGGIDGDDRDTWTWPTETLECSSAPGSPVTVYGVYYTDTSDTVLLAAQEFAGSFTFTNADDGFDFTPTFSFGSIY